MFITILDRFGEHPFTSKSKLFLTWDNWNDYSFRTLFGIFYIDDEGIKHNLGSVKIGYYSQEEGEPKLNIKDSFETLPSDHFSLGSDEYYECLNKLGSAVRDKILLSLNDIAKYPDIYNKAIHERVTEVSFLRNLTETEITGQLRRIANGGVRLIRYDFRFTTVVNTNSSEKISLDFTVIPESNPPTNINVLIGRNGSGKTTIINNVLKTLLTENTESVFSQIDFDGYVPNKKIFPNLISVSFSAFDENIFYTPDKISYKRIKYNYIGLKKEGKTGENDILIKSPKDLTFEFFESLNECKKALKNEIWKKAIDILESDKNFKAENVISLIERDESIEDEDMRFSAYKEKAMQTFSKLSSGHKIVLLTITRLVEFVEEKTLVLIDEPETHLHPPLLSAFTRSLADLLEERNGVAIIATHSPVLLQEVPKSCVWKLIRNGDIVKEKRLRIESFGEDVGILTHEVFSLEVTSSGFHRRLKEAVQKTNSYEDALGYFKQNLGLEAQAILRALFYQKNKENEINNQTNLQY